ncbi:MAG: hypothetical protein HQL80_13060 [Magnetococcales bacterium]|nr:hypothetical protein [Magnetococcales bacterium]MBF0585145.1 hypothetical protein [Magnetococcales bacterium]
MERFGPQDGTGMARFCPIKKQAERAIGSECIGGRPWNDYLAQWNDLARKENGDDLLYSG